MNVNELTIGQAKELLGLFTKKEQPGPPETHPWKVGENYFIRTVTHHFTGNLVGVYEKELELSNVAWIADDGRFTSAVATGSFNEVEPYPNLAHVIIGRGSIIDAVIVTFPMPRSQK